VTKETGIVERGCQILHEMRGGLESSLAHMRVLQVRLSVKLQEERDDLQGSFDATVVEWGLTTLE
jgi:hypothetical protein